MRRDRAAGACARFGAHLSGEEEKRLERLQSEDEALHEAVEAARHACACLRIGGLSAVPSTGAVPSTAHAEPKRSNVLGGEGARDDAGARDGAPLGRGDARDGAGARDGAPLGRGGARDGAGARPRYDRPLEHAAPREPSVLGTAPSSAFEHAGPRESSADELGVAGAQPLTPSPMHSRTLAQPFLCP